MNDWLADPVCLSTGSPQGCVLSLFLFILYTNNCGSWHENRVFNKFLCLLFVLCCVVVCVCVCVCVRAHLCDLCVWYVCV